MRDLFLDRYCMDQSPQAAGRLMEMYYPLVYSVCRRYLRRRQDVEDAAQETFIKLLRHAGEIHGNVQAWLTATAYSNCIDVIRRANSERRQHQNLRRLLPARAQELTHQAIHARMHAALLELDQASRDLLIERFIRKAPLRVIAMNEQTAVGTISRRTSRAVSQLASVLRNMGIESADDLTVAEHFGDPANLDTSAAGEGLRFAPDWRAPALAPAGVPSVGLQTSYLPGWSRPLRVGALVSHRSSQVRLITGGYTPHWKQVRNTGLMTHPGIELVGIVEPGTSEIGPVEQTLRDYELFGGLIDSSDSQALRTLDVILLGMNHGTTPTTLRAFVEAVRSGVGLLNELWAGRYLGEISDQDMRALMLADSPVYAFHTKPRCHVMMRATVKEEHPVLPGYSCGRTMSLQGCGPLYQPVSGARVLIVKDHLVPPEEHCLPGLGPLALPAYIVGQLGRGRVAAVHMFPREHGEMARQAPMAGDYMLNLLTWLAEPRREPVARCPNTPSRPNAMSHGRTKVAVFD